MFRSVVLFMGLSLATGFSVNNNNNNEVKTTTSALSMTTSNEEGRREFFTKTAGMAVAGLGVPFLPVESANAVSGANKVNAKLKGLGLAPIANVKGGFSPLLEVWGKGANRIPILVQFQYPLSWVVTLPSNDVNGEDGTVQAGDYAKGDTATFFVYDDPGNVKDISNESKDFFKKAVSKAISQKGENMYQDFKVIKTEPRDVDGQQYVLVDFKYELLTGAGFTVERRGVASVTSQGKAVEVLWCATIAQKFKKNEETLRYIAESFRCYTDGINFANELYKIEEAF